MIALVLAAPYLLQLFREDTTIKPADFNKAVAVLNKAQKLQGGDFRTNAIPVYGKIADGVVIELNSADSAKITGLKGILKYPYFTFKQMNSIVQFREQHGDYASLNDMRNIVLLNDEILRKIEPYIDFK